MGVRVDPLIRRIPDGFLGEQRTYIRYLQKVVYGLWLRTGGLLGTVVSSEDGDVTTGGASKQVVIMTNSTAKTVTLHDSPTDLNEVIVKRQSAQVTIDGNGKTIDGEATQILTGQYDAPHMVWTDSGDEWSIV